MSEGSACRRVTDKERSEAHTTLQRWYWQQVEEYTGFVRDAARTGEISPDSASQVDDYIWAMCDSAHLVLYTYDARDVVRYCSPDAEAAIGEYGQIAVKSGEDVPWSAMAFIALKHDVAACWEKNVDRWFPRDDDDEGATDDV